jgi:hypothetical protein
MLIMPCRASAARCRVQVTSNVRHPGTKVQMQDARFGNVPPKKFFAKVARTGGNSRIANRSIASESGNSNHRIRRFAQAASKQSPATLGSSLVRQGGQTQSPCARWLLLFPRKATCGSIQNVVATISAFARMPNHSVKGTRNSAPRWPGETRYAHSASPVQRVTLLHAPYLKR